MIWGGNIVAIKIGVTELAPTILLVLRFTLTALVFLPFMKWPGRKQFWQLAEIALFMSVLHQGFLFFAAKFIDASTVAILLQSQIMFATLLGWLMLKETIRWKTATGLGIGFFGLLLTLGGPDLNQNPAGFVLVLLSTLVLAHSYIRLRQLKTVHPATFIALTNGLAVPFVVMASLFSPYADWLALGEADWTKMSGVLVYQVLIVSVSHIVWQVLLSRNPVAVVTSFVLLMPVVAIILSALILKETLHSSLVWGGGLTLLGVAIIMLRKIQKKTPINTNPVL